MKKIIFFCLLMSGVSCYADIHLQAAPATYARSWEALDNEDRVIGQGAFKPGDLSGSTGYTYAAIPNDNVYRIRIISKKTMYLNGTPNDLTSSFVLANLHGNRTYELTKKAGTIVVEQKDETDTTPNTDEECEEEEAYEDDE